MLERAFVWAGGAMFVGSLALMVWTYGATFRPGAAAVDAGALLFDLLLITLFALHHSLFARERAKRAVARLVPSRLVRALYVWIASVLLIALCLLWRSIGGNFYGASGPFVWALRAIQLLGLLLIASSVTAISPLELAGIRAPEARETLQDRGPYRLVRHPLYLGWVLCVFGAAEMTGDRLTFAAATTLYLFLAVPWEERALAREFPAAYPRYRQKVRWRIIPYVY